MTGRQRLFSGIWDVPRIFEDGKRNRQQGDVADRRCPVSALQFYTSFSDPPVTVVVLYEVVFCQCGHIGEGQPGEGGEDKDVAYQCQPGMVNSFSMMLFSSG